MIKKLIMATRPLLIYDTFKDIQFAWAILNLTILTQYILHGNKTFWYINHTLYRLEKIKIAFE